MNKDVFIGIENELVSYKENTRRRIGFEDRFSDVLKHLKNKKIPVIKKGDTSIRTGEGLGYYVDGQEIEILTPPIPINKGFATRLTDLLAIGRNTINKATPDLVQTGYSTHWNISNYRFLDFQNQLHDVLSPIHALFGTTPLSKGIGVRFKGANEEELSYTKLRMEVLTDHINNLDQVNAHALLIGSYVLSQYFSETPFTKLKEFKFTPRTDFTNGRYTRLKTATGKKITAQSYVEGMYKFLEPYLEALATETELTNLQDFIEGKKQLEFDKFKYYSNLKDLGINDRGRFFPADPKKLIMYTPHAQGQDMPVYPEPEDIPLEGKLLGSYAHLGKQKRTKIKDITWNYIKYKQKGKTTFITGATEIYKHAANQLQLSYTRSLQDETLQPIPQKISGKKHTYNPDKDHSGHTFKHQDTPQQFKRKPAFQIKNYISSGQALTLAGFAILGGGLIKGLDYATNHVRFAGPVANEYAIKAQQPIINFVEQNRPGPQEVTVPTESESKVAPFVFYAGGENHE